MLEHQEVSLVAYVREFSQILVKCNRAYLTGLEGLQGQQGEQAGLHLRFVDAAAQLGRQNAA